MRVLYELAHHGSATASELVRRLLLDAGYLSRIVSRFAGQGWINRAPSPTDARQQVLTLTEAGRGAFEPLQQRSREEAAALLAACPYAPDMKQLLVEKHRLRGPDGRNATVSIARITA